MYKQLFSVLTTLAAALAFALTPGVAMAQPHGGGHGGGGHGGGGHGGGHAGGGHATFHGGGGHASFHGGGGHASFHGGGFHGGGVAHTGGFHGGGFAHNGFHGGFAHDGFRHDGFRHGGWGWGSAYGGWGFGYPLYSGYSYAPSYYDYGYAPSYYGDGGYADTYPYDYGSPSYSDYNAVPAYGDTTPPALGYDAQAALAPDTVAHIDVIVPPNAKVWFGTMLTRQIGSEREFASPPLTPGQDYTYDITARWTANGQEVTRTRRIDVRANSSFTVDFTRPAVGQ